MTIDYAPLKFATLSLLDDGKLEELLAAQLKMMAQDCIDRPGETAPRKVIVEFVIKPKMTPEGNCDESEIHIECKGKLPVKRTHSFPMLTTKAGFKFNREFPESRDQKGLGFDD